MNNRLKWKRAALLLAAGLGLAASPTAGLRPTQVRRR